MSFTLLNQGEPDRVDTGVVSSNFFDMLGIRALHGRTFLPNEDDLGAEAVLVLSHQYWKERFGADPAIVGRVFEMNNRPHTVVGVFSISQIEGDNVDMPTSACPVPIRRRTGIAARRSSVVCRPDRAGSACARRHRGERRA